MDRDIFVALSSVIGIIWIAGFSWQFFITSESGWLYLPVASTASIFWVIAMVWISKLLCKNGG